MNHCIDHYMDDMSSTINKIADIRNNMRVSIDRNKTGIIAQNLRGDLWRTSWRTDILVMSIEIESNLKFNNSLT